MAKMPCTISVHRAWTSMKPDCPCMTANCLVSLSPCASKGFPVAMTVKELWTGCAISRGGSLLYIFIAANASPTVGFKLKKSFSGLTYPR